MKLADDDFYAAVDDACPSGLGGMRTAVGVAADDGGGADLGPLFCDVSDPRGITLRSTVFSSWAPNQDEDS